MLEAKGVHANFCPLKGCGPFLHINGGTIATSYQLKGGQITKYFLVRMKQRSKSAIRGRGFLMSAQFIGPS